MGERTVWTCDGCGDEKVVTHGKNGDWNKIEVKLSGFHGYPVGEAGNRCDSFHLCPPCQNYMHGIANPRGWPRAEKAAKPGDPAQ